MEKIEINFPLPSSIRKIIDISTNVNNEHDDCYFDYIEAFDPTAKEMVDRDKLKKAMGYITCELRGIN